MDTPVEKSTIATTRVQPRLETKPAFLQWQAKLNAAIAAFPGFLSLEIVLSTDNPNEWLIVQRFQTASHLMSWRKSDTNQALINELRELAVNHDIQETESTDSQFQGGVTEVLVTRINPAKEQDYRQWIAKIHQVEAKFPGFRGAYVQAPATSQGNWITLLQFDTIEHLDQWLSSPERQDVLKESSSIISSLENHRMISPYAGWFSSITSESGEAPPAWKQTMLVLLVLFPIVMLEFKYLNPLVSSLNLSLGTFIGNALSVTLVSWPMMPIAIWLLGWWLNPQSKLHVSLTGTALVLALYILEIALFWNFL